MCSGNLDTLNHTALILHFSLDLADFSEAWDPKGSFSLAPPDLVGDFNDTWEPLGSVLDLADSCELRSAFSAPITAREKKIKHGNS